MNFTIKVAIVEFVIGTTLLIAMYFLLRRYKWKLFGRINLDKPLGFFLLFLVLAIRFTATALVANTDAYQIATSFISTQQVIQDQTGAVVRIKMIRDNFYVPRRHSAIESESEGAKAMYNLCVYGEKNMLTVKISLTQAYETGIWSINEWEITE